MLDARVRLAIGSFALDAAVRVNDGELVAVVGPNGAGKTTLLRALAGLAPLDEGVIRVGSQVVDDPDDDVFVPPEHRPVGVVFQDYLLFPHLSVLDNVAFGLRERGHARRAARARAAEWLGVVRLDAKRDAKPHELSGGEAQRVALARALATEPQLLLLDEPFAALDVQHRAQFRHDLGELLQNFSGARLLVTHDAVDALTLADRIVILEGGRVVQEGDPDAIVACPLSPYVADLVGMNVYRGDAHGRTVLLPRDATLTVADEFHGPVIAIVAPHAVVLHRREPSGTARNVWRGSISGMERLGDRVRVQVTAGVTVVAEVTAAAVADLDLRAGVEVWAAVKATEIAVYSA